MVIRFKSSVGVKIQTFRVDEFRDSGQLQFKEVRSHWTLNLGMDMCKSMKFTETVKPADSSSAKEKDREVCGSFTL